MRSAPSPLCPASARTRDTGGHTGRATPDRTPRRHPAPSRQGSAVRHVLAFLRLSYTVRLRPTPANRRGFAVDLSPMLRGLAVIVPPWCSLRRPTTSAPGCQVIPHAVAPRPGCRGSNATAGIAPASRQPFTWPHHCRSQICRAVWSARCSRSLFVSRPTVGGVARRGSYTAASNTSARPFSAS